MTTEWEDCVRCRSPRVVPGGIADPLGATAFVIDCHIADRPSAFSANHKVELEPIAWLCLDCGLAWQETTPKNLEAARTSLLEKCRSEFREKLFGE